MGLRRLGCGEQCFESGMRAVLGSFLYHKGYQEVIMGWEVVSK